MEGPERRCPKGIEAKFPSCIVFSLPKHCNGRPRPRGVFAAGENLQPLHIRQSGLSPDKTTSRSISSDKNHDIPDGRPLRLARQNHFGSQCATECVYRHLPAKVKLTRSHFGKPPLTECVLRHPPCQSELAEAPTVLCDPPASQQKRPKQQGNCLPEQRCLSPPRVGKTP